MTAARQVQRMERRATLLLEVVLSVMILGIALATLGAQLSSGVRMTIDSDKRFRAAALATRLLGQLELDQELQKRILTEGQSDGDFGLANPGYHWTLSFEPLPPDQTAVGLIVGSTDPQDETNFLARVRIDVYFQPNAAATSQDGPGQLIHSLTLLKASPPKLNLESDYGVRPEQSEALTTALNQLNVNIDPNNLDPQQLVTTLTDLLQKDPGQLAAVMTQLMALMQQLQGGAGGGGGAPDLNQLANLLQQGGAGGNLDPAALQQLQQNLFGGVQTPGAAPGGDVFGGDGGATPPPNGGGFMPGGGPPGGGGGGIGPGGRGGIGPGGGGPPGGGRGTGGAGGAGGAGGRGTGGAGGAGGAGGRGTGGTGARGGAPPGSNYTLEDLMQMRQGYQAPPVQR